MKTFRFFVPKINHTGDSLAFLAFLLYLPSSLLFKQGLSVSIALLCLAGVLALWCGQKTVKPWLFLWIGLFPLLGIILAFGGYAPPYTLERAAKFFLLIGVSYFVFFKTRKLPFREKALFYGVVIGIFLCTFTILTDFYFLKVLGHTNNFKKKMDTFSLLLSLSLWPLIYVFFHTKNSFYKLVLFILIFSAVYLIFFQLENHTARYCLVIGLIVAGSVYLFQQRLFKILLSFCVIGFILGMPWIIKKAFDVNTISRHIPIEKGSFYHRVVIWDYVAQQIISHPLKMRGFDMMRGEEIKQKSQDWNKAKSKIISSEEIKQKNLFQVPHHPHNAALQIWQEFGVWGALLFCIVLLYIIHLIDRFPTSLGRALAYSLFVVGSSYFHVSYGLWETKWWFILAIIFGLLYNLDSKSQAKFIKE